MLKLPIVKLVISALPEENLLIEPEVANKLSILPIVKLVIEALPEENVLIEPEVANKLPILTILVTFNLPPNVESPVTVKPPL